ncbi:MAG: cadmium resistance transporter [Iphinoe sp. HA4291-MV1]|jgi:cadmium resistance transport/sequestration family protein|nr:cadmium resistance transporter [Iphinoe sp. HA4291-MV1]
MTGFITAISTGVAAFSATNIDDIIILMLFFSQVNATLRHWHIITGQYLGFAVLVIASLPGFFSGLFLPQSWLGLCSLLPIAIGIKCLLSQDDDDQETTVTEQSQSHQLLLTKFLNLQIYSVAAITIANGTDNISIYVPLFASSTWESLLVILSVFFTLVGVLCYAAYRLTHQQAIADILTRYGNSFMPFVLIGLGAFIFVKSGTLSLFNLFNSDFATSLSLLYNAIRR